MKKKIFAVLTSLLVFSGLANAGINISFNETVTDFAGLGNLVIDLVDVGLNTLIHVLQRFPEIAVLLFIVGVILGILGMVTGVFTSIGGIFRMFTGLWSKKR